MDSVCYTVVTCSFSPLRLLMGLDTKRVDVYYNDGIFLACEDYGRIFDESFPVCALFFLFFFSALVEISSHAPVSLFRLGSAHSQWLREPRRLRTSVP